LIKSIEHSALAPAISYSTQVDADRKLHLIELLYLVKRSSDSHDDTSGEDVHAGSGFGGGARRRRRGRGTAGAGRGTGLAGTFSAPSTREVVSPFALNANIIRTISGNLSAVTIEGLGGGSLPGLAGGSGGLNVVGVAFEDFSARTVALGIGGSTGLASSTSGILLLFTVLAHNAFKLIAGTRSLSVIQAISNWGGGGFASGLGWVGVPFEALAGWADEGVLSVSTATSVFTITINCGGRIVLSGHFGLAVTLISTQLFETFSGVSVVEASSARAVRVGFHAEIVSIWSWGQQFTGLALGTVEVVSLSAHEAFTSGGILGSLAPSVATVSSTCTEIVSNCGPVIGSIERDNVSRVASVAQIGFPIGFETVQPFSA